MWCRTNFAPKPAGIPSRPVLRDSHRQGYAPVSRKHHCVDEQGVALVYDSNSRERQRELSVLCRIVEVLAAVVPNGIVCFFASYNFLQKFRAVFEQSPEKVNVLKTKALFFETQEKGKTIFAEYSKQAFSKGAILFAVYGGSQSEGVDFADGLARLVLLVGQPYPPDGIKLQLRRDYFRSRSALQLELPKQRREIYATLANEIKTILCYKSINQSIGRAMRHKDDYAAIVLLDARYTDARAQRLLPCYVTQALQNTSEHGNKAFSRNVLKNNLTEFYRFQNKRT
ncbi:chromosome transmission fidelity protein 1 [Babesia caballi]|uniref:Chromosome transmission fidelity protein 1 n=1 Tax=Babesia caballi TaxID=5871 RepID=A0AAV4LZP8_BABCB|nr:chromosome transmission fidelity protein 1 [Babesia caballi]